MKNPTMFYKAGGPHKIHGAMYDYCVVDADEEGAVEKVLSEGWSKTTVEASEKAPLDDSEVISEMTISDSDTHCPLCGHGLKMEEPLFGDQIKEDSEASEVEESPLSDKSREELEAIAKEMEADNEGLNIAFNARTSDENLAAKILEAKKSIDEINSESGV